MSHMYGCSQWCCGEGECHASKGWLENCVKSKKLAFKILLALDYASGNLQDLGFTHPDIQV